MSEQLKQGNPVFPTTHWSEVMAAGQQDAAEGLAVLERLIIRYQGALRAHLLQKYRIPDHAVDDVMQSFTAEKILKSNLMSSADAARGRFRTFLLTALDRFYLNEVRRSQAKHRFPVQGYVPLEELGSAEPKANGPYPGLSSDLAWVFLVLESAQRQMLTECQNKNREDICEVFAGRTLRPHLEGIPKVSYEELVQRLGLRSPEQASNVLITGNRMFLRHLRAVVGEYCRDDREVEDEIEDLKAILSQARA